MAALFENDMLWSPALFAALVALAMAAIWMAFKPATPLRDLSDRLDDYLERGDIVMDQDMSRSFGNRALVPVLRSLLRAFGRLLPQRNAERTRVSLEQAGNPRGLTPLDFYGIRVVVMVLALGLAFWLTSRSGAGTQLLLRNMGGGAVLGYVFPLYWLRGKVSRRRHDVQKALPDALDMLTVGVEAGLAFESAMVRVGEKWDNPLTREFRRAVAEMRVGTSREESLTRMAARCGVSDLSTFVAVLVQSTQLGVSIADVLHGQAEAMRVRRRQRAEELARAAGIKMLIPLVFFIFPALLVAIIGPAVPVLLSSFGSFTGG